MVIHSKIQKWGNSLALRISGSMRDIPHFKEGTPVNIEIFEEGFLVKKAIFEDIKLFPYSETQLLNSLNADNAHSELLTRILSTEIK